MTKETKSVGVYLDRAALDAAEWASSDGYRPDIQNVQIEDGLAIATNGQALVIIPLLAEADLSETVEAYGDDPDGPVRVRADLARAVRKNLRASDPPARLSVNGTPVLTSQRAGVTTHHAGPSAGDGYPNWKRVVAMWDDEPVKATISLSVENLDRLVKTAKRHARRRAGCQIIRFEIREPEQGVWTTFTTNDEREVRALIMPVRE